MALQKFTTFNEMERWLDENRVTEVECLVPDLTGIAKGKILPRNKFSEERGMRLPEAIFGATVTGEYPEDESLDAIIDPTDMDMELRPDPSTVRLVPWANDARTLCHHAVFICQQRLCLCDDDGVFTLAVSDARADRAFGCRLGLCQCRAVIICARRQHRRRLQRTRRGVRRRSGLRQPARRPCTARLHHRTRRPPRIVCAGGAGQFGDCL